MRIPELKKPVFIGFGMFFFLLLLTQLLSYFWYRSAKNAEMSRLDSQANAMKERLHITLSNSLSCTRTLAFIVEEHGVPNDFDRVARKLLSTSPLVDAIELLRGGVITHVFPIDGNEAAVGYDILSDTIRHNGAVTALRTRDFYFAGPVKLKQGGIAVIGRQPIFIDGKFWGFSAVLIRLSNFVRAAGIDVDYAHRHDFRYQIARVHPWDNTEEFFLPSEGIPEKGDFVAIQIPNTEWRLYVSSVNLEKILLDAIMLAVLGLSLSAIVGIISCYIAAQPVKLNKLVNKRTTQLTAEKELSESIINSLPGIFYLYDEDRKFFRWNRNFETVSGYTAEEVRKMHPLDFFEGEDKNLLEEKIATVFEKGDADVEAHFYTKSGEKITYYFNGNACNFNGKAYLIGMGIDITKRIKAERDIHDLNLRLEATVDRLRARNNDLQQFSYVVSHNLRAPIAKILGLASIFNDDPEETQLIVTKIAESAHHLDEVVRDISMIVSARDTDENRAYISFDQALALVLKMLEDEIRESNAAISLDFTAVSGMVTVRSYFHSILYNLLSNAIKYRRKDQQLQIRVAATATEKEICITVADNGMGIDLVKNAGKIFGMYKRFSEEHVPGKGVGLCLVKNQVESLGGRIEVASRINEGSTFSVYLPLKDDNSTHEPPYLFN